MRKIFLLVLSSLITLYAYADSLTATVNRQQIAIDESILLTVSYDGAPNEKKLNIDNLRKDFQIVGNGQSQQIQSINGHTTAITNWTFSLLPKKQGQLTIPSLSLGDQHSQAITITVSPSSTIDEFGQHKDIFMQTEVDSKTPYVQSQLLYTVKIFNNRNVRSAQLTDPKIDQATAYQLGADRTYSKNIDNKIYQVLERKYAIIPQQAGPLTIISPVLHGSVFEENNGIPSSHQFFINELQPITVRAENVTVQVKPIPVAAKNTWWLPAKNLTLEEHWSTSPEKIQLGQPVTRTIVIKAIGLTAEQLPELQLPAEDGLQVYPDKPILNTDGDPQNLLSTRTEKYALIANKSGKLTFPEIKLPWWNTEKNKAQVAVIPPRTITISGVASETSNNSAQLLDLPTTKAVFAQNRLSLDQPELEKNTINYWLISTAIIAVLWILTIILLWKKKGTPQQRSVTKQPISQKEFKLACNQNNPKQAKLALLNLAKQYYPEFTLHNLEDLKQLSTDQDLHELLDRLNQALYTESSTSWDGHGFFSKIQPLFKRNKQQAADKPVLPEFYPKQS